MKTVRNHIIAVVLMLLMVITGFPVSNIAFAEDAESGVFRDVSWRITKDGELIIGEKGKTQTFSDSYEYDTEEYPTDFPWKGKDYITSAKFEGNVIGYGDMSEMFYWCEKLESIDLTNFNTENVTNMNNMFGNCSSLITLDLTSFNTSNVTDMTEMFLDCSSLISLDLSSFDTRNVRYMYWMFGNCSSLESLDLSGFDLSNISDNEDYYAEGLIFGCNHIMQLRTPLHVNGDIYLPSKMYDEDGVEYELLPYAADQSFLLKKDDIATGVCRSVPWKITTDNVLLIGEENKAYSFSYAEDYEGDDDGEDSDYTGWDWYQCVDDIHSVRFLGSVSANGSISSMFIGCSNLIDIDLSNFDTKYVTSMGGMFSGCSKLTHLDVSKLDTKNVENMTGMFSGCKSLTEIDITKLDTRNINAIAGMFAGCSSLQSLDVTNIDTGKVTDMCDLFAGCSGLTSLDVSGFDTSNVTNMWEMFSDCSGLKQLDLTNFDTGNVYYMQKMFKGCSSLTNLDLTNFNTSGVRQLDYMFSNCSSLKNLDLSSFDTGEVESMRNMFEGCSKLTNLDLSSFDMTKILKDESEWYDEWDDDWDDEYFAAHLLKGCKNLRTLKTPLHVAKDVSLPVTMYDEQEMEYTALPKDMDHSITLTAKGIPEHEHEWDSGYTVDTEPTCSAEGSESVHCKICGAVREGSSRAIPKKEHSYTMWSTIEEATEIEKGTQVRICTVCGYAETGEIEPLAPTLPVVKIKKPKALKKAATIKWKKISKKKRKKIKKVQIQCSTDKYFRKNVKTKYAKSSKNSYKIKGLKSGKKYYVRIRAYTVKGLDAHASKWSKKKSFKAK